MNVKAGWDARASLTDGIHGRNETHAGKESRKERFKIQAGFGNRGRVWGFSLGDKALGHHVRRRVVDGIDGQQMLLPIIPY